MAVRVVVRTIVTLVALFIAASSASAQQAQAAVVYVDSTTPSLPRLRAWTGSTVSPTQIASPVGSSALWEMLLNNPKSSERALLSLTDNRTLSVQFHNGTSWSAASTIATDLGYTRTRTFGAAYEQNTGRLLVAYRKQKSKTVYYRIYTGAGVPAEQSIPLSTDTPPQQIMVIAKPNSNELIVMARTLLCMYTAVWNGSSWVSIKNHALLLPWRGQPFDGAYMSQSGKAMFVWSPWLFGGPRYAIWDGAAWTSSANLAGFNHSRWMSIAADPQNTSNRLLLGAVDRNRKVLAASWDGSAWSAVTTLDSNCSSSTAHRMHVCYQTNGAAGLIAWHSGNNSTISYSKWSGGAWGPASVGPNVGGECRTLTLAKGPGGNEILMATVRKSSIPVVTDYTVYSALGAVTPGSAVIDGLTGAHVAGVLPPVAPVAVAGLVPQSVAAGATLTLAPGAYGALTMADDATLNLSGGTYTFSGATIGNSCQIRCDTSATNVVVRFTLTGFTAGDNFIIQPNDDDDPGEVFIHVNLGNTTVGASPTITTGLFWTYAGSASFGSSAAIISLIYASGNVTLASGDVDPSDQLTPGGQLNLTQWKNCVPQTPVFVTGALGGGGTTEPFWLCGTDSSKLYIKRWREIGPDE